MPATSWKTTLIGVLTSALYMIASHISGGVKPRDAIIATGISVLGILAKDFNVTGGNK